MILDGSDVGVNVCKCRSQNYLHNLISHMVLKLMVFAILVKGGIQSFDLILDIFVSISDAFSDHSNGSGGV
ncbi:Hypothetical predicted protein [Octopus vulgaris]|uniref:Uncharacterized protein n=1 Tax=Octopus vulgaris TaxID=6645 RepID=A0AA36F9M3_OCTVU|nr:Hypothetical predicted protein [Octopus vulgaris]